MKILFGSNFFSLVGLVLLCGAILLFFFGNIFSENRDENDTKSSTTCDEQSVRINSNCIPTRQIEEDVLSSLKRLDRRLTEKALTSEEIDLHIGPVFDKYMSRHNSYGAVVAFYQAIIVKTQNHTESDLRLLLNIMYYHDNHGDTIYAEFSEGLRDNVITFISDSPDTVIRVAKDKNQLNRELIPNAYYQFIDPFAYDSNSGEINDKRFTIKHEELMKILKQEKLL